MTTPTTSLSPPPLVTRRALTWHRPLLALAVVMAIMTLVSIVGLLVDQRELVGAPVWAKPFKFSISIVIYAVTMSWLIAQLKRKPRLVWWAGTIAAIAFAIEMVIIVGAVITGTTSHFNVETPLNRTLWMIMAASIVIVWLMTALVGVLLLRERLDDRARAFAIRSGVIIGVIGMALAFLMTQPTSAQLNDFQGVIGAHAVGVPDDGPALPILGWSTVGGDLRVPHFIGIHALQLLPIAIILLELLGRRVSALRHEIVRLRIVVALSALYAGVVALLTVQALMGQSVVRPDGIILAAGGALFGGAALAIIISVVRAPRESAELFHANREEN